MKLYYSSPSEEEDPPFTILDIVHSTCWVSGKVTAYFTRIDYKGLSVLPNKRPVGVSVYHQIEKSAFDEIG